MPKEAIEVADSPIDEPLELTADEFRAKLGIDKITGNSQYVTLINQSRIGGWTTPDGRVWFLTGSKKEARWSTVAPVTAI